MSTGEDPPERPEPRARPSDPAGTRPKVDPESLVPAKSEPLIAETAIDSTAIDEDDPQLLPERIATAGPPGPAKGREDAPHAPRFQFLFGALVTLGIAALATVVVIAASGPSESGSDGAQWSRWHPMDDGPSAPEQIAQHVSRQYRLSSGEQLVLVTGGPLEVQGVRLTVALRQSLDQGGNISLIEGKGVLYHLCGLGRKCSINKGKPSAQRLLLLRREALELALYTFRYTDADHVVALLPPGRTKKQPNKIKDPDEALFFQRDDVNPELNRPVTATLAPATPRPSGFKRSPDAGLVVQLTGPRVFKFSVTPGNLDGRALLVLQR